MNDLISMGVEEEQILTDIKQKGLAVVDSSYIVKIASSKKG
jgi:hypothetical protein